MKAKELAEILLTVPEWEVCISESNWGVSSAKVISLIDPRCKKGDVILGAVPSNYESEDDQQS